MNIKLLPGNILDDRYEILSVAGSGGMGTVYRAKQIGLDREVAVKLLDPALLGEDDSFERFEREARSIALVHNEHITTFYNFGIVNQLVPYIAMEYLDGPSLAREISDKGQLGWHRAARICQQICNGMQAAHDEGIVHRDLKPNNIVLLNAPSPDFVKIVDFGLAKLTSNSGNNKLTVTGQLIGSVNYLSPEQCLGRKTDYRSDIYSVACILYEMLCGQPPFENENPVAMLHLHVSEKAIPISKRMDMKRELEQSASYTREQEPGDAGKTSEQKSSGDIKKQNTKAKLEKNLLALDAIIQRGMEKDPDNRYQSMSQMEQDLKSVLAGNYSNLLAFEEGKNAVSSGDKKGSKKQILKPAYITLFAVLIAGGVTFAAFSLRNPASMSPSELAHLVKTYDPNQLSDLLVKVWEDKNSNSKMTPHLATEIVNRAKHLSNDPLAPADIYILTAKKAIAQGKRECACNLAREAIFSIVRLNTNELQHTTDLRLHNTVGQIVQVFRKLNYAFTRTDIKEMYGFMDAQEERAFDFNIYNDLRDYIISQKNLQAKDIEAVLNTSIRRGLPKKTPSIELLEKSIGLTQKINGEGSEEVVDRCLQLTGQLAFYGSSPLMTKYCATRALQLIPNTKGSDADKLRLLQRLGQTLLMFDDGELLGHCADEMKRYIQESQEENAQACLDLFEGIADKHRKNYSQSEKLLSNALAYLIGRGGNMVDGLNARPIFMQADNLFILGRGNEVKKLFDKYFKYCEESASTGTIYTDGRFAKDTLATAAITAGECMRAHHREAEAMQYFVKSLKVCHDYRLAGYRTMVSLHRIITEYIQLQEYKDAVPYVRELVDIPIDQQVVSPGCISALAACFYLKPLKTLDSALYKKAIAQIDTTIRGAISQKNADGIQCYEVLSGLIDAGERQEARALYKIMMNGIPPTSPGIEKLLKYKHVIDQALK